MILMNFSKKERKRVIMTDKERFTTILKEECKDRFDVREFINWLEEKTDFFDAPASSKYHLSERGGLLKHSLNVYDTLVNICSLYAEEIPLSTIAIVGLLHDICKINFYSQERTYVKVDGKWIEKWGYVIQDNFPIGHGEKSVIILQQHFKLTKDEIMAIRWHMAGFDYAVKGGESAYSKATLSCKLLSLLEISDMLSSRILEGNWN